MIMDMSESDCRRDQREEVVELLWWVSLRINKLGRGGKAWNVKGKAWNVKGKAWKAEGKAWRTEGKLALHSAKVKVKKKAISSAHPSTIFAWNHCDWVWKIGYTRVTQNACVVRLIYQFIINKFIITVLVIILSCACTTCFDYKLYTCNSDEADEKADRMPELWSMDETLSSVNNAINLIR